MLKRVYHPINKDKIQEAIDAYNEYWKKSADLSVSEEECEEMWDKFIKARNKICPGSNLWAAHFFQAMSWSGTLTVERVYYTIIASGVNITVKEVDDE